MMIRQLAILFGCLALGELIIYLTHIPLPSSILGMLLLTLLLPIVVSTVVSTILVLAVTGWVHQFYGKAKGKLKG